VGISEHSGMNRRHALRTLAAGTLGSLWVDELSALARQHAHAGSAQAAIAAQDWKPAVLNPRQNDLVVLLTELIIPETDTPGAKAARVNRFIDRVLQDARPADRERFLKGLAWIEARSRALYKTDVLAASPEQQTALLTRLSADGNPDKEESTGRDFFTAVKSMTINGYYTTEIGLRRELGDSGQLFLPAFQGCDHPDHQA
jgi:hypothetical protein